MTVFDNNKEKRSPKQTEPVIETHNLNRRNVWDP